ncbi:phosphatase PAP2 family protein [Streptomyces clavuligerus]|uniref:phosphatase PAP2 family protein n=1 Tax=Streptomyces clavuligerus TaxID=1901 RepID=UPI0027DD97E8|nr:phosphatase PAP2 family protein [Streptomyces clavuligerus]
MADRAGLLPLTAVVGATAWSRLRLGRHTPAQVVVGVTVGAAVAGTVFTLLR